MAGLDTTTVMAVRELLSAAMFGLVLLAVPGGVATAGAMLTDRGLTLPIVVAGMVGGYSYAIWYRSIRKIGVAPAMALNISYAMWGALFAWILYHTPVTLLAISGCAVVTAGAVVTILSGRHRPTVDVPTAGVTRQRRRGAAGCGRPARRWRSRALESAGER
jgi:drug/metabolite transporter (DMT)-like permease